MPLLVKITSVWGALTKHTSSEVYLFACIIHVPGKNGGLFLLHDLNGRQAAVPLNKSEEYPLKGINKCMWFTTIQQQYPARMFTQ